MAAPKSRFLAGPVAWTARNIIAANLLMFALLLGGVFVALDIKQEVFPSFQLPIVEITVPYPGASPEEVEDGILLPIEESLRGLDGIERVDSSAEEGSGSVLIELGDDVDPNKALQDIAAAVDRISFFPDEAERPVVGLQQERSNVMWMVVHGPLEQQAIQALAEKIRLDLMARPELSQVDIPRALRPEIRVEIPQESLRSLGLTLGDVADTLRDSARDVPAGGLRTDGGEYLLRSSERRDAASEYGNIPIYTAPDGATVLLEDVADIREGFEDKSFENWFNGGRGVFVTVYRTGDEKPLEVSRAVHEYLDDLRKTLPEGVDVAVLRDRAEQYDSRLDLLLQNGALGLGLVLLILGLFLQPRLAFWVAVSIPTTLLGAVLLLPTLGATINMVSLFAFIITLGIVVDDAVIVGENVFHQTEQGVPPLKAAVDGTLEMIVPVLFAVATNVLAFLPLLFVPGETGRFFAPLPAVVIAVFMVSLVEALFILPAHLGNRGAGRAAGLMERVMAPLRRAQAATNAGFQRGVDRFFVPFLRRALVFRWITLCALIGASLVSYAYYSSGRLPYTFNPVIAGARVDAEVRTPPGAPFSDTVRIAKHIEAAGVRTAERFGDGDASRVLRGRMNVIGRLGENWADVNFILVDPEKRDFDQAEFVAVWREEIGEVIGLESLFFEWEEGPSSGAGLTIELSHPDRKILETAAAELAAELATYDGVTDIKEGFAAGKPQIDVHLTPKAKALGLSPAELGGRVREAFFGAEVTRVQRGRHEVKTMVRLPRSERQSLAALEELAIRLPDGGEAPLMDLAMLEFGRASTRIDRIDGRPIVSVTSNVDAEKTNINDVRNALEQDLVPELSSAYPGLRVDFGGRQREERRAMDELMLGLGLVLVIIFALLAAMFRSYVQAFIVMSMIPIALAAAMWGHVLLGHDLSVVSLFGMIALCGLVVNGGFVLNQAINERLEAGESLAQAAIDGARRRFRPVVLTSVTTFVGLAPMIVETDPQALFLVPMAIALGFGTVISGLVLLVAVPCARVMTGAWGRSRSPATEKALGSPAQSESARMTESSGSP